MNDLSFNVRSYDKYVIVNFLVGDYNREEFIDHHEAEALAEYLKEISDELMTCVQGVNCA